ncbi:uncharacterized protein LOC112495307, partial [Cephus cinctus]|uniref:Uncharacterized protein LOC112495307 n=1 Tax=Cephus cinctus TaxID=211228 RepID=A0AAJ7W7W3_CEPCN
MDSTGEYDKYRCSTCKKPIKSQVVRCKTCVKLFYHPGCVNKHKVLDRNHELVACSGPFEKFNAEEENQKTSVPAAGSSRDRVSSVGSIGGSRGMSSSATVDMKIDWLIKTVKAVKDEITCKNEVKKMIKEVVGAEMEGLKQQIEELKRMIHGEGMNAGKATYSEAVKEKKKEMVIIVKPKLQQESEATKRAIKEKVDIKNMAMGITKLKKGSKGTVILGCESGGEIEVLKAEAEVKNKMGEGFKVTESTQMKPKIKIVNIEEEELNLTDEELVDTIKTQNGIEETEGREWKIVKRLTKGRQQERNRRGPIEGSIILEVDEATHEELLSK